MKRSPLLPLLCLVLLPSRGLPDAPATRYERCGLGEWTLRVESRLLQERPEQAARALALIEEKLNEIDRLLPQDKLEFLRERPIWLSRENGKGAEYHPSRRWLVDHDRHPDMAGCIEISNVESFLAWSENQPMMILHELAHALHHRGYNFGHPPLRRAYAQVKADGRYDAVPRWQGRIGPAYAMSNHKEYFAELTEACFGLNDIFPFSHDELRRHDPNGYAVMRRMWMAPLETNPIAQTYD